MFVGPNIVRDNLVLHLDAGNEKSYPGTGTVWKDLSGNNKDYSIGSGLTYSNKTFNLSSDGAGGNGALNPNAGITGTSCTLVFWIKSSDLQGLFWGSEPPAHGGSYFVGAYRVGNKGYHGNSGTPEYHLDLTQPANIYDSFPDGEWHMVEFKNVNFSTWTNQHNFSSYGGDYSISNGECAIICVYNKTLTSAESKQNFNALKSRFL